jgi:hypothetical protein
MGSRGEKCSRLFVKLNRPVALSYGLQLIVFFSVCLHRIQRVARHGSSKRTNGRRETSLATQKNSHPHSIPMKIDIVYSSCGVSSFCVCAITITAAVCMCAEASGQNARFFENLPFFSCV